MNLKSTPFLVLFVILGSIALTTAFAGDLAHDIELDGNVWVTETLMIDGDGIVMEDFIVEGDGIFHGDIMLPDGTIIVGGNPVPIIIVGADDPNVADIDGKKGDIYIQDNGKFAINIDPFDENSWSFGNGGDGATLTVDVIDPPTLDGNKGDHWVNTETGQVWIHLGFPDFSDFAWVKVDRPGEGTVFVDVIDPGDSDGAVGDHWLNENSREVFLRVGDLPGGLQWISIGGTTGFVEDRDPEDSDGVPGDHWTNSITRQVFLKLIDDTWQSLGPLTIIQDRDPENTDGAVGDLWKNTTTDTFFVKFADGWLKVGPDIFIESIDPDSSDGKRGDHWLNTDTGQLWLNVGDPIFWIKVGTPSGETSVSLIEGGCVAPVDDFCNVTLECPVGEVALGTVEIPSDSVTGDPSPPFSVFGGCDIRHDPLTDVESASCEGDAFEQPNPVDWHFRLPCVTSP